MEDANLIAALFLFTIIGGAIGARIGKADYWRGAVATAGSILLTGALFVGLGSNSQILSAIGLLFAMLVICSALRMKGLQIASTILGAYLGLILTGSFYFWTGQGVS